MKSAPATLAARNAYVRLAGFARAIHHTAHHRYLHWHRDVPQFALHPRRNARYVNARAAAGGTGYQLHTLCA